MGRIPICAFGRAGRHQRSSVRPIGSGGRWGYADQASHRYQRLAGMWHRQKDIVDAVLTVEGSRAVAANTADVVWRRL
jgi:hypothetical protein